VYCFLNDRKSAMEQYHKLVEMDYFASPQLLRDIQDFFPGTQV
jgi:hypothetical protein